MDTRTSSSRWAPSFGNELTIGLGVSPPGQSQLSFTKHKTMDLLYNYIRERKEDGQLSKSLEAECSVIGMATWTSKIGYSLLEMKIK